MVLRRFAGLLLVIWATPIATLKADLIDDPSGNFFTVSDNALA